MKFADNVGGQLARLERALKSGANVDALAWYDWLERLTEDDDPLRYWAIRVSEMVVDAMTDEEYRRWGEIHGWVDEDGKWHAPNPRDR